MGHYVYKYVLNDEIIYIGKNDTNLQTRIMSHETSRVDKLYGFRKKFGKDLTIYYAKVSNKLQSDLLESFLIDKYKPKFNEAKKYKGVFKLFEGAKEPRFFIFKDKAKSTKKVARDFRHIKGKYQYVPYDKKELFENMLYVIQATFKTDYKGIMEVKGTDIPHCWMDVENPSVYLNMPDGSVHVYRIFSKVSYDMGNDIIKFEFVANANIEVAKVIMNYYKDMIKLISWTTNSKYEQMDLIIFL